MSAFHTHHEREQPGTAWRTNNARRFFLDIVDVDVLAILAALLFRAAVAVLVELEADALVALVAVGVCLVDLGRLGEFAVGF